MRFLDPGQYVAYHAGNVRNSKYSNEQSIGIETHYSNADSTQPIHPRKIENLTELVKQLLKEYNLSPDDISLHRLEAIPKGRKPDPNFWSDIQFEQWRGSLSEPLLLDVILNGIQTDPIHLHRALNKYAPSITQADKESIVSAYTTFGELTTIGNAYPFAQAAKETAWFSSERFVKSYNPAGLGADDTGAWGHTFATIAEGVLAQYAHLLCYAVPDEQLTYIQKQIARMSPRRNPLIGSYGLGVAGNRWQGLSRKWNSPAGSSDYGKDIIVLGEKILDL